MSEDLGRFNTHTPAPSHGHGSDAVGAEKPPELVYGSAEEFLHVQLLPTYIRDVDGHSAKWCIEWYFHSEAVSRVPTLWRAWEHLRLDGATGMSVWWRDHADHHERILLDLTARFTDATCKPMYGRQLLLEHDAH
jgi:hypothetical protein